MGRFVRDFGFFVSLLLLLAGIYCLVLGTENRAADTSRWLISGALFLTGGFIGIVRVTYEHLALRRFERYTRGCDKESSSRIARQ